MKLLYGLIAGAIAAVVASLVQLPLTSPDDAVFNAGTVTAGALAAGLALGALWTVLSRAPNGMMLYAAAGAALFGAGVLFAFVMETQLDRSIEYIVPLVAIFFAIATPLVPLLSMALLPNMAQYGGTGVALVAALAIGIGLAGQGDSESGKLSLPDVSNEPTAAPGETVVAPSGSTVTAEDVAGVVYTVGEGSGLTYTVREKLASLPAESDAVGRTGALTGTIRLDGQTQIEGDMSTLTSDQSRRDNTIQDRVFQGDTIVTVVIDDLGVLPDEYTSGETFTGTVTGNTTVVGVTKALTYAIEARLVGNELQVLATTDFTWADFNITPPDVAGIVTVTDNVHIEVLLIATGA